MTFPPFPRSDEEKHRMKKTETHPDLAGFAAAEKLSTGAQEKKREMREIPPAPPKESKGRNKRTSDGDGISCDSFLRPRARAYARRTPAVSTKMRQWLDRMEANGFTDPVRPTVDEAVRVTGGTDDDRLMWLKIANRGLNTFLGVLMDFEYDLERHTSHPLRNPAAAFQARLNRVLPKGGAK